MDLKGSALIVLVMLSACRASPPATATGTHHLSPYPSAAPTDPAPSPVLAATATPPPPPRLFTEEFHTTPSSWVSFQTSGSGLDLQVRDGWLVFDLAAANDWAYAVYGGQEYADVRVEALGEDRAGGAGSLGVVCRYDEADGWYEFNIYPDRTYMLLYGQWLGKGNARYDPLYRGGSEKIRSGEANQIGLLCQGGTLTPFINGVQLRKWEEKKYALESGRIGLAAASFEGPSVAAFDWLQVSEP